MIVVSTGLGTINSDSGRSQLKEYLERYDHTFFRFHFKKSF